MANSPTILLTGVTGYVGGRLLLKLQAANHQLKCLVRDPERVQERITANTKLIKGNVLDKKSLLIAMEGIDCAFYLVHSMGTDASFTEEDRTGAVNFAEAASECHVRRIIYLGGLGDSNEELSKHLKSRQEVGDILREKAKNVQVIEFRASIIIGSGSLSFEMIRALCERLPIMITPKWVWTMGQPIAIRDVLSYLIKAIDIPVNGNPIFEIGGKEPISYGGIMLEYIKQRKLKRFILPVPVLTPWLSSLWLGLVTPLYARIGRKLIDSAVHPTIVRDRSAEEVFNIQPITVEEAIRLAIEKENESSIDSHWSDALSSSSHTTHIETKPNLKKRIIDQREIYLDLPPEEAFRAIRRIGGSTGWYFGNILWSIRGFIDRLFGGVGLRRGRRSADNLRVGDSLDFWRVETYIPNQKLLLLAEMKLPGKAWLEFEVKPKDKGSTIQQTAIFDPKGIAGLMYWYLLFPFHFFIFRGLLKGIAQAAISYKKQIVEAKSDSK